MQRSEQLQQHSEAERSKEHELPNPDILSGTGKLSIRPGKIIGMFHVGEPSAVLHQGNLYLEQVDEDDRIAFRPHVVDSKEAHHVTRLVLPKQNHELIDAHSHMEKHKPATYFNREHGVTHQPSLETMLAMANGHYNGPNTAYAMIPRLVSSRGYSLEVVSDHPVQITLSDDATIIDCYGTPDEINIDKAESPVPCRREGEYVKLPTGIDKGVGVVLRGSADEVAGHVDTLLAAGTKLGYVQLENIFGSKSRRHVVSDRVFWGNTAIQPGYRELIADLQARDIDVVGYLNPYMESDSTLFDEFAAQGWLVSDG